MVDREEWVGGGSGSREGEARAHFYPLRVDAHAVALLNVSRCTAGFIMCIYSNPRPMPRMKEIRQHHFSISLLFVIHCTVDQNMIFW